jgi:hypothetical protein
MPVVLSGTKQAFASLRKVSPEAAKAVKRKVAAAAKPLASKARGFAPSEAPLSGWGISRGVWANRTYVASEVRKGIGFSQSPTKPNRNGYSYTAYIYNKSVAGAIYETAGRKNPNGQPSQASTRGVFSSYVDTSNKVNKSANPEAGKQFIDSMGAIYKAQRAQGQSGRVSRKMNGRLIFRAWGEDNGKVIGAVAKAYDEVVDRFNKGAF